MTGPKLLGTEPSWLTPGGGVLARLDLFLCEPLRQAPPEDLSRYRLLISVALVVGVFSVAGLLSLPWSPHPWIQGGLSCLLLGANLWALRGLRRPHPPEQAALAVCGSMAVVQGFICVVLDSPSAASHALTMLLPAVSVYLLGVRLGLYLTLPVCVLLGVLHPLRFLWFEGVTGKELAELWLLDGTAALYMLGMWAVSGMHTTARLEANSKLELAMRTLRESEHQLSTLVENTDDPVCSFNLEGRYLVVNSALRRYHQNRYGTQVLPGDLLLDRIPSLKDKLAFVLEHVRRGEGVKLEDVAVKQGQTRVLEMSFKPIRDEQGTPLGATLFGRDVTDRKEAEYKLTEMHRSLVDVSRQAGMAEVVTGLLHNVGNALNSINVSVHLVTERIRTSRVGGMVRAVELLRTHHGSLANFLEQDSRGKQLPSYMHALAQQLVEEQQSLLAEQRTLTDALDHVKSIIGMQQEHARVSAPMELVRVGSLIDDALRLHAVSFQRSGIDIQREYEVLPPILLDRHKLLQILLNLLSNARHALLDGERDTKRITIRLKAMPDDRVRIQVADTGQGITAEHLTRMFTQGFTTKKEGHGFGLHISALAAIEMAGTLSCESEGPDQGATFTIDLPMQAAAAGIG